MWVYPEVKVTSPRVLAAIGWYVFSSIRLILLGIMKIMIDQTCSLIADFFALFLFIYLLTLKQNQANKKSHPFSTALLSVKSYCAVFQEEKKEVSWHYKNESPMPCASGFCSRIAVTLEVPSVCDYVEH